MNLYVQMGLFINIIFNKVCDLVHVSIDNFNRNSVHQSRITNFFECLQRVLTFILCIYWKDTCLKYKIYLFWTHLCYRLFILNLYAVKFIVGGIFSIFNANDIYNE